MVPLLESRTRSRPKSSLRQSHQNVFEDTEDKTTYVLNLMRKSFKKMKFSRLCCKIWWGEADFDNFCLTSVSRLEVKALTALRMTMLNHQDDNDNAGSN